MLELLTFQNKLDGGKIYGVLILKSRFNKMAKKKENANETDTHIHNILSKVGIYYLTI